MKVNMLGKPRVIAKDSSVGGVSGSGRRYGGVLKDG